MDYASLPFMSEMFDMSPENFLQSVGMPGMMKAEKGEKVDGMIGPTRSFFDRPLAHYSSSGVRDMYQPIAYGILREIERKNPIVAAIVNTRCRQVRQFARPAEDESSPGYQIILRDRDRKPTKAEKEDIDKMAQFVFNTGRTDFKNWDEREDLFSDVLVKIAREYLTIDQVALELRYEKQTNKLIDFWVLDGATIKRVIQGGFSGSRSDINPRLYVTANEAFWSRIEKEKLQMIPEDLSAIAYVQEIEGRYVAAYSRQHLIFDSMQKRADIRYHGMGYSPLEQAMAAVTAFLWGLAYNAAAFNRGAIPKVGISIKEGNLSPEQMKAMQDEWIANHRGPDGAWRIPIFNREVSVLDFLKSAREMEYRFYLEFSGSLIASVMGMDLTELGLRYQHAQNVLNENVDAKQKFSKDRGLHDMLSCIDTVMNKMFRYAGWHERYLFRFTGLSPEDVEAKSKLDTDKVRRHLTINEYRKTLDMQPIKYGDVILDASWMNYASQQQMSEQQGGDGGGEEGGDGEGYPEGFGGEEGEADQGEGEPGEEEGEGGGGGAEEFGQAVDEGLDEGLGDAFKAVDPKKLNMRTMLLK